MAIADALGGTMGTSGLSGLIACLILLTLYRTVRFYVRQPLFAVTIAVLVTTVYFVLPARPHQWSHLGMAVLAYLFARYDCERDHRIFAAAPLLFLAWVNLHGGYSLGLVTLAVIMGFFMARALMEKAAPPYPLFGWGIAAVIATLVNPYGIGAWQYVIDIGKLKATTGGVISEWLPTSIMTEIGLHLLLIQIAILFSFALSKKRPTVLEVGLIAAFAAASWSATRVVLMMTPMFVPLLAKAAADTKFADLFDDPKLESINRVKLGPAAGIVVMAVMAAYFSAKTSNQALEKYLDANLPVREAKFLIDNGLKDRRVFNDMDAGGYLISQGFKVSIDGRLDLYGDEPFMKHWFANRGMAGWQAIMDSYNPDVVLINRLSPLVSLLTDSSRYRPVFYGSMFVVMLRSADRQDIPSVNVFDEASSKLARALK